MAILKNVVQVNNGNTGWTKTNVLNALEQTFTNLGFHGGSQVNGVVCCTLPPGSSSPHYAGGNINSAWRFCGGGTTAGAASYFEPRNYRYFTTTSGSSYVFQQIMLSVNVNYNNADAFALSEYVGVNTGDAVVFDCASTINISGGGTLVNGTTYYVIVINNTAFKLATTYENAIAGTAIDITTSSPNISQVTFTVGSPLVNPNFTIKQSDTIKFSLNTPGHPLFLQDTAGAYNSARLLNSTNFSTSLGYRDMPVNLGSSSGEISWDTKGWQQGNYYYVCQHHSTMTGTITVLPNTYTQMDQGLNGFNLFPHWDYTVPASGLRSSLQLRVFRFPRNYTHDKAISGVEVLSVNTSGWSNEESFTIPGDQIGSTTPAGDLTFGVNNATTPSIAVTNLGAGVNFYQKFTNQSKAILKVINDPSKTYGTTYYGFSFNPNNSYELMLSSGSSWEHFNYNPNSSTDSANGRFGGLYGLDISLNNNGVFSYNTSVGREHSFASSSTPTAYPLKIITYRAQAPQDTNFAIIQFVQTINASDVPYFTFFLHKGSNYGAGIWDLNHVWQGGYNQIYPSSGAGEGITLVVHAPSRYNSREDPNNLSSVKRECLYGYFRDATDTDQSRAMMTIKNNLFTDNTLIDNYYSNETPANILPYYRNSQYDKGTYTNSSSNPANYNDFVSSSSVSSNVNFYKPLKGIPLNSMFAPCPYYLPDDFVTIPFVVSPGATLVRVGDTVTVSSSEVYEVVTASYTTNQTTYDGISQNTSKGIAFCARTT